MRDASESHLIERAKAYDAEALSELYRRHADAVFRYVYYRVGDRSVAEDLVGDVFVRALEGLTSFLSLGFQEYGLEVVFMRTNIQGLVTSARIAAGRSLAGRRRLHARALPPDSTPFPTSGAQRLRRVGHLAVTLFAQISAQLALARVRALQRRALLPFSLAPGAPLRLRPGRMHGRPVAERSGQAQQAGLVGVGLVAHRVP